ncbi:unnamed protein product [Fusarium venenatum]|uniref:Uncharacterized protein n=1 Tax=Fusarium venenatum TaxID=56646 RepID=A0A2L2SS84_9HYPO|nr:uncharacterized protein FVRRES_12662 [Fusarium venenatum]CEI39971.1 unnamed protein product [Fusarium venenatum]
MRRHLKAWLEVRKSRSKNEVDPAPQMPCLTSPRPRVLTPSSSKQDLSLPLQSSPLFSKLPTEIRRRILLFAFGDRTVHMDLALEHPFKAKAPALSYDHRHGKLDTLWRDNLDRSRPRIWKWKGCALPGFERFFGVKNMCANQLMTIAAPDGQTFAMGGRIITELLMHV